MHLGEGTRITGLAYRAMRKVFSALYRSHVAYEFPFAIVKQSDATAIGPPVGYTAHRPTTLEDLSSAAGLLNQEAGFGIWNAARVQDELIANLAHPEASTLVLKDGQPVGVIFATDASTRGKKIAHGMYLYVAPQHRGSTGLAPYLVFATLKACIEAGYEQVLAFTDPSRMSAHLLYLTSGARPVHLSLWCHWRWRKINRRLAPALRRAAARRGQGRDRLPGPSPSPERPEPRQRA